jgi:ectoine hydroxylase
MKLSTQQLQSYRRDGFLFVERLFSSAEAALLSEQASQIAASSPQPFVINEADGRTPRTIVNPQKFNPVFAELERHPRIIGPAMQLLNGPVCTFQIAVNQKAAMNGDFWPWHQDWPTYKHDDGIPEPQMVNAVIFLDDVCEFNGPIMLAPGSQVEELPLPDVSTQGTSFAARYSDIAIMPEKLLKYGIVAPKGPAGSVCFQHTNILHGSGPNLSPWRRSLVTFTLNAVANRSRGSNRPQTRPAHMVCEPGAGIVPLEDDCLARP